MKYIIDQRKIPISPFFCEDKKGKIFITFNGGHINLSKLKKCRKALNFLIESLDNKVIRALNTEIDLSNKQYYKEQMNELEPTIPKKIGYVYLIKQDKYYKIGRAQNIKSRVKIYKTENPKPIKIILQNQVDDYIKVETELLRKYKHKQYRGEWFLLNNQDVKDIEQCLNKVKI